MYLSVIALSTLALSGTIASAQHVARQEPPSMASSGSTAVALTEAMLDWVNSQISNSGFPKAQGQDTPPPVRARQDPYSAALDILEWIQANVPNAQTQGQTGAMAVGASQLPSGEVTYPGGDIKYPSGQKGSVGSEASSGQPAWVPRSDDASVARRQGSETPLWMQAFQDALDYLQHQAELHNSGGGDKGASFSGGKAAGEWDKGAWQRRQEVDGTDAGTMGRDPWQVLNDLIKEINQWQEQWQQGPKPEGVIKPEEPVKPVDPVKPEGDGAGGGGAWGSWKRDELATAMRVRAQRYARNI